MLDIARSSSPGKFRLFQCLTPLLLHCTDTRLKSVSQEIYDLVDGHAIVCLEESQKQWSKAHQSSKVSQVLGVKILQLCLQNHISEAQDLLSKFEGFLQSLGSSSSSDSCVAHFYFVCTHMLVSCTWFGDRSTAVHVGHQLYTCENTLLEHAGLSKRERILIQLALVAYRGLKGENFDQGNLEVLLSQLKYPTLLHLLYVTALLQLVPPPHQCEMQKKLKAYLQAAREKFPISEIKLPAMPLWS